MRRRPASRCVGAHAHAHASIISLFLSIAAITLLSRIAVEALPKPKSNGKINGNVNGNVNGNKQNSSPSIPETESAKDNSTKIFSNINENYQSSSTSLKALNKQLDEDMKEGRLKMRKYWKQTFEEIKESNPVVFGEEGVENYLKSSSSSNANKAPRRFDGFQTWEKQLQQWSEDVSLYMEETENQLNELLQPKEPSSRYDLGNFGIPSSRNLKQDLTQAEIDKEGESIKQLREGKSSSSTSITKPKPTFPQLLGLDTTTTSAPVGNSLPITLTALDKNLLQIPKPRPVAAGDTVLPHTDIADKSKNIWIVTTGALPWMTGTAVNPLLRAAYLSTGRKQSGGSVTLMLPWVEREADQERVYGKEKMFETPADQEEYIRTWLRDTADMRDASEELNIEWYTAWQEVLENSLYSMGDIIGLIPVSGFTFLFCGD